MNATGIEYLDFTWSPLVGCSGLGCAVYDHCWAKYMKKRNLNGCQQCTEFKPHTHFERIDQPYKTKKPSVIGACYSADMWDKGFNRSNRVQVLTSARMSPQHIFINLTKQTQNINGDEPFPANWIQGASICIEEDLYRTDDLRASNASLLALSIEPLYEDLYELDLSEMDWVIIGGQTKPIKLPQKEWVNRIISQAKELGIPVFIKNNLDCLGYNLHEYPTWFTNYGKSGVTSSNKNGEEKQ